MSHRWLAALSLVALPLLAGLPMAGTSWAETLIESNVDQRLSLGIRVSPPELQTWIPTPWQAELVAEGPSKGANLFLVFIDKILSHDADGKPRQGGTDRGLALAAFGKHAQTGEMASVVIRIFTANPQAIPGPYKNSVQATVRREFATTAMDLEPAAVTDRWEIRPATGGVINLETQYRQGLPARTKPEDKVYSAVEPAFFRIYRVDQGGDVLRSVACGVDRLPRYELRVAVPELAKLFDGSEQLISLTARPWYMRQVSLP
jgi:hypothetical protein